jgi:hypothetical protein
MKQRVVQFAMTAVMLAMMAMPKLVVAEDQPHMRAALQALEEAKKHLQEAEHDKGGHRAKALQLTDQAIAQVKQGMRFDEKHEGRDHDKDHDRDKH